MSNDLTNLILNNDATDNQSSLGEVVLTYELLHSAGTYGQGFNAAQLHLLGVKWPPKKGWLTRLIGTRLDVATWNKVMRLRSVRSKRERIRLLNGH